MSRVALFAVWIAFGFALGYVAPASAAEIVDPKGLIPKIDQYLGKTSFADAYRCGDAASFKFSGKMGVSILALKAIKGTIAREVIECDEDSVKVRTVTEVTGGGVKWLNKILKKMEEREERARAAGDDGEDDDGDEAAGIPEKSTSEDEVTREEFEERQAKGYATYLVEAVQAEREAGDDEVIEKLEVREVKTGAKVKLVDGRKVEGIEVKVRAHVALKLDEEDKAEMPVPLPERFKVDTTVVLGRGMPEIARMLKGSVEGPMMLKASGELKAYSRK